VTIFRGLVLSVIAIFVAVQIGTVWAGLLAGALSIVLVVYGFMREMGG
jgi:hypothetical protein